MTRDEAGKLIDETIPERGPSLVRTRIIAGLLGVSDSTVATMAKDGWLLRPVVRLGSPTRRFPRQKLREALLELLTRD